MICYYYTQYVYSITNLTHLLHNHLITSAALELAFHNPSTLAWVASYDTHNGLLLLLFLCLIMAQFLTATVIPPLLPFVFSVVSHMDHPPPLYTSITLRLYFSTDHMTIHYIKFGFLK